MTESDSISRKTSVSDDSLVLVESGDALPPATEEVTAAASAASAASQIPPSVEVTMSVEDSSQEQEGMPILATNTDEEMNEDVHQSKSVEVKAADSPPCQGFSMSGGDSKPRQAFSYEALKEVVQQSKPADVKAAELSENSPPRHDEGKEEESDVDDVTTERKVGAGIAIGLVTAPLCGPVLAVVAGVAAAYGTSQEGVAGDACRAAGDIAIVAKEKAIEVDKKHDLVNKTKNGANQLLDKAKDANERHEFVEKVKHVIVCTLKNVAAALQFAADKMKESREKRRAEREAREEVANSFSYEKVDVEEVQK